MDAADRAPIPIAARVATEEDREELLDALGFALPASERDARRIIVCVRDSRVVFAGDLLLEGGPTEPGVARLERRCRRADLSLEVAQECLIALIREAQARLRAVGRVRLLVPVEIADSETIGALERCGMRSTPTGPYRPLGPSHFEPLIGYTGIEGFWLDYALEWPPERRQEKTPRSE